MKPPFRTGMPVQLPAIPLLIQVPAHAPEKGEDDGPNTQAPIPMWEMEFLALGLHLAQSWLLQLSGERTVDI